MSTFTIREESADEALQAIFSLLPSHYEEVAVNKEHIKLNPDYEAYRNLYEAGNMTIMVARDDRNNAAIGYCIFFLTPHIHYKDKIYANNDIIYVHPNYRHCKLADNMLKMSEERLRQLGVSVMLLHMKVDHPFDELCLSNGYSEMEKLWYKYIGD